MKSQFGNMGLSINNCIWGLLSCFWHHVFQHGLVFCLYLPLKVIFCSLPLFLGAVSHKMTLNLPMPWILKKWIKKMMYEEKKSECNKPLLIYTVCSSYIYFHIVVCYLYILILSFNYSISLFSIGDNGVLGWDECIIIFPFEINGKDFSFSSRTFRNKWKSLVLGIDVWHPVFQLYLSRVLFRVS